MSAPAAEKPAKQLLHLVFGGELEALDTIEFANLQALDIVGIYPTTRRPTRPGRRRRSAPSTTRRCATSSCTCTGCWIRMQPARARANLDAVASGG